MELKCRVTFDPPRATWVAGWRAFVSYMTSSEEDLGQAVRSSSIEAAIQPDGGFSIIVADDLIRAALALPDLIVRIDVRDASGSEAGGLQLSGREFALAVRREAVVTIDLPSSGQPKPNRLPRPQRAIPTTIRGRIEIEDRPDQVDGFDGYDITANFRLRTSGRPGSATEELTGPNRFALALPERKRLAEDDVELTARYPSGIIAGRRTVSIAELDEPAVIRIASPSVRTLTTNSRAVAARLEKLKGKVIQLDGTVVPDRQIVLWNSPPEGAPQVVIATRTDQFGGFTAERPPTRFEVVTATVSGTLNASPTAAIGVTLESQDGAPGGRLPSFIYLVVEGAQTAEKAGHCSCEYQTPRLPDQADLTGNPGAYSQDIGGSCTNFTVPNRTLEEFTYSMVVRTTEPVVKGTTVSNLEERDRNLPGYRQITSPISQRIVTSGGGAGQANLSAGINLALTFKSMASLPSTYLSPDALARVSGRGPLNASNAVDWDSEPTFYQATTIAHGHILFFKQVWKADGYSLGDLLYSLPLAPGQKKQIVVFDWDRTEFGSRDEATHEDEALEAYLSHNRDVLDITQGTVSEQMRGGSESRTSGKAGGIGGGLFGNFFGVAGGFAASIGRTNSSAWQDSSRSASATGLGQLRDSIQQGASAVRNQRSTVIQTARQAERFRVETEVVANYNHCHAITVQYFEVLRHYSIEQRLSHVQECLFVPLLMSMFDEAKVIRWFDILKRSLRYADRRTTFRLATGGTAFRKRSLLDAFDAVERRLADPDGSQQPETTYAAEKVLDLSGDIHITLELNRPVDKAGDAAQTAAELDEVLDDLTWNPFFVFLPYGINELRTKLEKRVRAERDRIFQEEIAPEIASKFVALLRFAAIDGDGNRHDLDLDATLVSRYVRGQQLYVSLRPNMAELPLTREQIVKFVIFSNIDLDRAARSRVIVNRVTLRYRTARYNGVLIRNDSVNNDLKGAAIPFGYLGQNSIPLDNVVLYTPLNTDEMRNPRREDGELVQRLLVHLNGNLEYYHQAIWARMDPQRRFMLLDGFVVPNSDGLSVASVVENRVIGVAGNSLIMPVVPGYKLDPNYELEPELDADGKPVVDAMGKPVTKPIDLLAHYEPVTPTPPFRVSVPTRGVFAEAVMGACNSCEKKDETRFWRWEESPLPDQPTAINPVGTQPPQRSDPGGLTPTPFPTPMVNIQNAPAAPEPGAALGSAMALLGKSDLFRDMAGLDQTQKNALQAMLSNQQSAMHYADKATELATLGANQRNGGTIIDGIKKSIEDGTLDRETGKKLIEDVYRAQISGKIAPEQPTNTANQSKLADAAANAVKEGREVKVEQSHPDGTQTLVEQKLTAPPALPVSAPSIQLERSVSSPGWLPVNWVPIPAGEGPGFAKFDRAFDATLGFLPSFPDWDSGAFRLVLHDPSAAPASVPKEAMWQAVFSTTSDQAFKEATDTTAVLTQDPNDPTIFRSKPLVIVTEPEDLPQVILNTSDQPAKHGERDYRARVGGMFGTLVVQHAGVRQTFPILSEKQRSLIMLHVFVLKANGELAVSKEIVATRLREMQRVYEPHGIYFNVQPYNFSADQTSEYKVEALKVGTEIEYDCREIDVTDKIDVKKVSVEDTIKLATEFAPKAGGPAIRSFFCAGFSGEQSNNVAYALNKSWTENKTIFSSNRKKIMFTIMITGVSPKQDYAVAHEIGHLLMDKTDTLKKSGKDVPDGEDRRHYTSPDTLQVKVPGYPSDQNLMRLNGPIGTGIHRPRRIWNVDDANGYNWAADLQSNAAKLQIRP